MQAYDKRNLQATSNSHLSPGLRYAPQRIAQLIDPRGGLATTNALLVSPRVACTETLDALRAHRDSGGSNPTRALLFDQARSTQRLLAADPLLGTWYPGAASCVAALGDLVAVEHLHGPLPRDTKRATLIKRALLSQLPRTADAVAAVLNQMNGIGYVELLARRVDHVIAISSLPTLEDADWTALDRALRHLSTEIAASGRDGRRVSQAVANTLWRATTIQEGASRLKSELLRRQEPFDVAFVIRGAREIHGTSGHLCFPLSAPAKWPGRPDNDSQLTEFVRVFASDVRVAFATHVAAYDSSDAAEQARERARELVDQISAGARAQAFWVEDQFLVRRCRKRVRHTKLLKPQGPYPDQTRPRFPTPLPLYSRSLRYAATGRADPSPVVGVLQLWIALEGLFGGGGAPSVSEYVPKLMTLASIRQGLSAAWAVFRRDARLLPAGSIARHDAEAVVLHVGERFNGRAGSLERWCALLAELGAPYGPLSLHATQLQGALAATSPFARRLVGRWCRRVGRSDELVAWLQAFGAQSESAILRMRLLRNGAAHHGVTVATGDRQLRQAASDVVDLVHEVIPLWTQTHPARSPDAAFRELAARHQRFVAEWGASGGRPRIPVDTLLLP